MISSMKSSVIRFGSYGAESEELPDNAIQIYAQLKAVEAITQLCLSALKIPKDEKLELVQAGRC